MSRDAKADQPATTHKKNKLLLLRNNH